jgi:uncharacterized membrane protein YfcA
MGYGTTLTPILLIAGFGPLEVVPAVLLGQIAGGLVGGLAHHRMGNINLDFRRDEELIREKLRWLVYLPKSADAKVVFVLVVCGIVGALVGVFSAVHIPSLALKAYIGAMVLAIGIVIVLRRRQEAAISWKGLMGVGLISAFNKGISGGGYGPLVTGGQIMSGGGARNSVGNTTLAEGMVCIVGFLGYLTIGSSILWMLAVATAAGSIVAAPFAAMTVRKIHPTSLKYIIGLLTIALGTYTLVATFA